MNRMFTKRSGALSCRWTRLLLLAFAAPLLSSPADEAGEDSSPFMIPQSPNTEITPPRSSKNGERLSGIEFNGYMVRPDRTVLSLFDRGTQKSFWLEVGGSKQGVRLESFDSEEKIVTVVCGDASRVIPLKKNKIEALRLPGLNGVVSQRSRDPEVVRLERAAEDELIVSMSVAQSLVEERRRELRRKGRRAALSAR